jgi:Ni,Fe-hydrogenase I large subunit
LPDNISSILNGSGAKCGEAITALVENHEQLIKLKDAGFLPDNISSILGGSGARCGEVIKILVSYKQVLMKLMKNTKLTASNISHKLHRSNTSIGKKVEKLVEEYMPKTPS